MDTTVIAKEFINYQKSVIENAFEAVGRFQEQTEKFASTWIERNTEMTVENHNSMQQWAKLLNKGSQNYRKMIDEHLNNLENLFVKSAVAQPIKLVKAEVKTEAKAETKMEVKAEPKTEAKASVKTNEEESKKQPAVKK